MKVRLHEIREQGLSLFEQFDPVAMKLQTSELAFRAPLAVTATFQKERETVLVAVQATGELELRCGRCLTRYADSYHNSFHLDYDVKGKTSLDVTDDIREEILLTYPLRLLCREDCRGLCAGCGENLNEGVCGCSAKKKG